MRKRLLLTFCLSFFALIPFTGFSQSTDWVFKVGDETVSSEEFMRVYTKNNAISEKPLTKTEIDEYLDLYVKFKLKVKEAYALKMDTAASFKKELAGYRQQLAQPYLTDKSITNHLIDEAYSRMVREVNASHILINCDPTASPSDTLKAYTQAVDIRKKILEGGMLFTDAALVYSNDPSAKVNQGNLGWFSAFQMIYPFENAAFKTEVGSVSLPVRTRFGYHLIKVNDLQTSLGEMKGAHIMIRFNNEGEIEEAKEKIDAIYQKLKDGESFEDLVKQYTQDFSTRARNGELNWFKRTSNNVPLPFRNAAFLLENDHDFSEPFKTQYGWHIVKRLELKPLASKEELSEGIKRKIQRDSRSELNKQAVIKRIKAENGFVQHKIKWKKVLSIFDSTILAGTWKVPANVKAKKKIFTLGEKTYLLSDFYAFAASSQRMVRNSSIEDRVKSQYADFVDETNLKHEENILEKKYDDFRYIMQEYRDGILLFELTDKEVWSKSVKDTTGLMSYYENNRDRYTWKKRLYFSQYSCKDSASAVAAKEMIDQGLSDSAIVAKLNSADPLTISVTRKRVEEGKDERLEQVKWAKGVYDLAPVSKNVEFIVVITVLDESVKPMEETLGAVTSDYQEHLETKWLNSLREKYPVTINKAGVTALYAE